jgi:hypothetical protein
MIVCTPDRTRTCDLGIRSALLYPSELRGLDVGSLNIPRNLQDCANLRFGRAYTLLRGIPLSSIHAGAPTEG